MLAARHDDDDEVGSKLAQKVDDISMNLIN